MARKRLDQIDIISEVSLGNLENNFIIIDSTELDKTFRIRLTRFLNLLNVTLQKTLYIFSDNSFYRLSDGSCLELSRRS